MSDTTGGPAAGHNNNHHLYQHPSSIAANVIHEDVLYAPQAAVAAVANSTNGSSRLSSWHIPRPSLVGRSSERNDSSIYSEPGTTTWNHHHPAESRGSRSSSSSQGSQASTHSAASGTLLLTAANLANLASMHPPTITPAKQQQFDETASVASSTHFTVVNGLGRPSKPYRKSWCARNQLTVLVCTMCFLFMVGLLAGVLYMDSRTKDRYN